MMESQTLTMKASSGRTVDALTADDITTTTTTTTSAASSAQKSSSNISTGVNGGTSSGRGQQLTNYVCDNMSVKQLFSLPYTNNKSAVSVGIHNVEGCLIIDADPTGTIQQQQQQQQKSEKIKGRNFGDDNSNFPLMMMREEEGGGAAAAVQQREEPPHEVKPKDDGSTSSEAALLAANHFQQQQQQQSLALSNISSIIEKNRSFVSTSDNNNNNNNTTTSQQQQLLLKESNQVAQNIIGKTPCEQYLHWEFAGMNLLVGSDALVYRSPETSLTVRVEDAAEMRRQLRNHHHHNNNNTNFLSQQRQLHQQQLTDSEENNNESSSKEQQQKQQHQQKPGKRSYAEALRSRQLIVRSESSSNTNKHNTAGEDNSTTATDIQKDPIIVKEEQVPSSSSSSGETPSFTLQTTMIPSTNLAPLIGGKFSISSEPPPAASPSSSSSDAISSTSSSPICTVIDAYLDQLITNVPQLALVLREKGFVQSVKLLQTENIPYAFLQEKTFDTSRPFEVINLHQPQDNNSSTTNEGEEQIFDAQVMKMNAASLLNFLRANCTKDNATYLLHREAGQTNIQLLDVTALSGQRQRRWTWWLAMMSYRFAQRLRHLSVQLTVASSSASSSSSSVLPPNANNKNKAAAAEDNNKNAAAARALRRSFRARERSLLQNTLSLLEEFHDMGGQPHEMLVAEVCEKLAETFLRTEEVEDDSGSSSASGAGATNTDHHSETATTKTPSAATGHRNKPVPATTSANGVQQRFGSVKPDALNKANDHLAKGIGVLRKVWSEVMDSIEKQSSTARQAGKGWSKGTEEPSKVDESSGNRVVSIDADASSSSEDEEEVENSREMEALEVKVETLGFHLLSLHDKTIDIFLRLAEHHMNDYFSSSAMQALRNSARRLADAVKLCQQTKSKKENRRHLNRWKLNLQIQFTRLWELCGHFARSFAADDLWYERGHCSGDDVVGVLRDVQSAIPWKKHPTPQSAPSVQDILFPYYHEGLLDKAWDLYDLSGIPQDEKLTKEAIDAAKILLEGKRQLGRDRRRVLVAASVSYSRASIFYEACQKAGCQGGARSEHKGDKQVSSTSESELTLLNLLRQRQGDANNELGKLLLQELRALLAGGQNSSTTSESDSDKSMAAQPLLAAAQFWFQEGLAAFESSSDIRNSTLLRCNLAQSYKLKANASFATSNAPQKKSSTGTSERSAHADSCLKEAISHLRAAHERLGQREVDPGTWDMVSNELAATLLVQGVRRRQSLLGGGNAPLLHLLRLSPGETRSIIDPMEKALLIYEESGNAHQAAAVHYQLALFYSKVWTCQRDEAKTREKLSAAFKHFNAAHAFFAASVRGNETTFILLCLDLSNLYSTVSGEECLCQALRCCLGTLGAFSTDAIARSAGTGVARSEWLKTMSTLAASVEDRLFKTLRSLVKTEEEKKGDKPLKFKDVYRSALGAKMVTHTAAQNDDAMTPEERTLGGLHKILQAVKDSYHASSQP